MKFKEIPAGKMSLAKRSCLFGLGINDAIYQVVYKANGKRLVCPYYRKWVDMLSRAYSIDFHETNPTYKDVTVCKEWLTFSSFRKWMQRQDWKGLELDKDIINPGNKVYSPENCCFVSRGLNALLINSESNRGALPRGVSFNKQKNIFRSDCRFYGKLKHLGYFGSVELASLVYRKFKANLVVEAAFDQTDERIERGLMHHARLIMDGVK